MFWQFWNKQRFWDEYEQLNSTSLQKCAMLTFALHTHKKIRIQAWSFDTPGQSKRLQVCLIWKGETVCTYQLMLHIQLKYIWCFMKSESSWNLPAPKKSPQKTPTKTIKPNKSWVFHGKVVQKNRKETTA